MDPVSGVGLGPNINPSDHINALYKPQEFEDRNLLDWNQARGVTTLFPSGEGEQSPQPAHARSTQADESVRSPAE